MKKPRLTTREAAKRLGVCVQRVASRIKQGHFPNHERCECGMTIMIPESDIDSPVLMDKRRKNKNE